MKNTSSQHPWAMDIDAAVAGLSVGDYVEVQFASIIDSVWVLPAETEDHIACFCDAGQCAISSGITGMIATDRAEVCRVDATDSTEDGETLLLLHPCGYRLDDGDDDTIYATARHIRAIRRVAGPTKVRLEDSGVDVKLTPGAGADLITDSGDEVKLFRSDLRALAAALQTHLA